MNVEALRAAMPDGDQLQGLDPYQRKKAAEDAIQMVLTAIAKDRVVPDVWETEHLLLALAAVVRSQPFLAVQCLHNAMTLADGRSPEAKLEAQEAWSIQRLESTLQAIRAIPAL